MLSTFAFSACGGASSSDVAQDNAEPEYIEESDFDALFTNPDKFKGKWVKLPGKALGASERDGDETTLQAYYDIVTYDRTYVVRSTTSESFSDGDYIFVDGMVSGTFEGENMVGGKLSLPLITNATITRSSYMETVVPATSTIEPAVSVTQNDVVFTCDKIEYADAETRVYLTIDNPTPESIGYGAYSICIISNGRQIDMDSGNQGVYEDPEHYPTLSSDLRSGASTSGVVVFPAMEAGKAFEIRIPNVYSEDYTVEFDDVVLEIPAA